MVNDWLPRCRATLESVGGGRYFVKFGADPLRPIYAYTDAFAFGQSPQKFMLDLRNRPMGPVPLPNPFSLSQAMP